MRNTMIRFKNMKAVRVGKGIKELRQRSNLSPRQLADKCGLTQSYLNRLEEGYELEVEFVTLENIARVLRVCERGKLTPEQLVDYFMNVTKEDQQPILI